MFGRSKSKACCSHSRPNQNYHRYWFYNLAPSPANRHYLTYSNQRKTITNFLSPKSQFDCSMYSLNPFLDVWFYRLQKKLLCLRFLKRGRDLQSFTVSHWPFSWLKPFEGWTNSLGKGPEYGTQHSANIVPIAYLNSANVNLSLTLIEVI